MQKSNFSSSLEPIFVLEMAQGSYSGYTTALNQELDTQINYQGIIIKEIFTPVDNRLFFIGEHTTILEAIGTMEAAIESGERIAKLFI